CLEKPAELLPHLLVRYSHRTKDTLLHVLPVDPDRPGALLPPVPDEVVMLAQRALWVRLDQLLVTFERPGERMMDERPAAGVLVALEEGKVENPQELVAGLVDQAQLGAEMQAERAEDP